MRKKKIKIPTEDLFNLSMEMELLSKQVQYLAGKLTQCKKDTRVEDWVKESRAEAYDRLNEEIMDLTDDDEEKDSEFIEDMLQPSTHVKPDFKVLDEKKDN